jgi:hypothetical protein
VTTIATGPQRSDDHGKIAAFLDRRARWILAVIVVLGAIPRVRQLSAGTLYPDDAWVALTNHFGLSTAVHMLVTSPGFTLFTRWWTGLAPHTTWFAQLPDLVSSLAGIVAVYALLRWNRLSTWVALSGAGLLAVSTEATSYATHLKPYPDDVLLACALLFVAERCRRSMTSRNLVILAAVAMACSVWSFSSVIVAAGAYLMVGLVWLRRREATVALAASAGAAVAAIGVLYLTVIHPQTTTSLSAFWNEHYLSTTSPTTFLRSGRRAVNGLFGNQLAFTPHRMLHFVGRIDEWALLLLAVIGMVVATRRRLLSLCVLAVAAVVAMAHAAPLGTNRTDAYLFPAVLLLVGSGLGWLGRFLHRRAPSWASAGLAGVAITWLSACLILNAAVPPHYPGGDLRKAAAEARALVRGKPHAVILVEGTARWPWAYGEDPSSTLIFGQGFNTGYEPVSGTPGVVIMPASAAETAFSAAWAPEHVKDATTLVTIAFAFHGLPEPELIADALRRDCWVPGKARSFDPYTVTPWHRRESCQGGTAR